MYVEGVVTGKLRGKPTMDVAKIRGKVAVAPRYSHLCCDFGNRHDRSI